MDWILIDRSIAVFSVKQIYVTLFLFFSRYGVELEPTLDLSPPRLTDRDRKILEKHLMSYSWSAIQVNKGIHSSFSEFKLPQDLLNSWILEFLGNLVWSWRNKILDSDACCSGQEDYCYRSSSSYPSRLANLFIRRAGWRGVLKSYFDRK